MQGSENLRKASPEYVFLSPSSRAERLVQNLSERLAEDRLVHRVEPRGHPVDLPFIQFMLNPPITQPQATDQAHAEDQPGYNPLPQNQEPTNGFNLPNSKCFFAEKRSYSSTGASNMQSQPFNNQRATDEQQSYSPVYEIDIDSIMGELMLQ